LSKSFVKGALILTIAGVLGKVLGAIYRIPFNRIAGEEAAAIYGLCYPVYTFVMALSTAGIPLAISKLVAEREEYSDSPGSRRIFYLALVTLVLIGTAIAIGVFLGAEWIACNVFLEPRAALGLKMLAPAIFFSCIISVFRGYFQGLQQMIPTALSQITEQFVRVIVIFAMVYVLLNQGAEMVAAGAISGASVGTLTAFLLIATIFFVYRKKHSWYGTAKLQDSSSQIVKKIIALAIPISIGALVLPIMQLIDSVLVINRLTAGGMLQEQALIEYGYLASYAGPIINLPFIVTTALAASLVPAVAQALAAKEDAMVKKNLAQGMLLAIVIVLPASAGLLILAEPICALLYDTAEAGVALAWVAFAVLGVGIYQISSAVLQGLGKVMIPMRHLLIGAGIKIVLTYTLTTIPALGIRGAALGTVIGFGFAALLNIWELCRKVGTDWIDVSRLVMKPLASVLAMAVIVGGSYFAITAVTHHSGIGTLASICIGGGCYFVVLLLLGTVDSDDLRKVPKIGRKLAMVVDKMPKKGA